MGITTPTRKPYNTSDDGLWANAAAAGDVESVPSNGEIDAGHVQNTGYTSGRANWLTATIGEWFQTIRDTLFPQHNDDGDHFEVSVVAGSGNVPVTIEANAASAGTVANILGKNAAGSTTFTVRGDGRVISAENIEAVDVSGSGDVTGDTINQSDTTERYFVSFGLRGEMLSSGTRDEGAASLGYSDVDSSTRTIRYFCPQLPQHATLVRVDVVFDLDDASNAASASLYSVAGLPLSSPSVTSRGGTGTITGSTGQQTGTISPSGTLTAAGGHDWQVEAYLNNSGTPTCSVTKVVWVYTLARF